MFHIAPPVAFTSLAVEGNTLYAYAFSLSPIITGTLYANEDNSRVFAHYDANYDNESYLIFTQPFPSIDAAIATLTAESDYMAAIA